MIDLHALSFYSHHLNATASDATLAAFNKLDVISAAAQAAAWVEQQDHRSDRAAAHREREIWS